MRRFVFALFSGAQRTDVLGGLCQVLLRSRQVRPSEVVVGLHLG
jgi:hypothetical protein